MTRLDSAVLTYYICAVVMWGSGLSDWEDTGIAQQFFASPGDTAVSSNVANQTGAVQSGLDAVVGTVAGPLEPISNFVFGLTEFLAWPVVTLSAHNAPWSVTALFGALTVAFLFGTMNVIIRAA